MTCFTERRTRWLLALAAALALSSTPSAQSAEELARRTLESGRAFLRSQNYGEAVKDFESVLQRYPMSTVADDALLELAIYQLQVVRDPGAADARAKELLKNYPTSDSAPMALIVEGRVALANGRDPEAINAALASFDRVARLFPGTEAVPASMYFGGEAARLGGRRDQAVQRFNQLATQFPNSPWTANALLGSALTLTRAGQPVRAMEQLQRVRNRFPNTPESATAMEWNTVLYRLYLRAPAQPAFAFSGRTVPAAPGKLKDVVDIAVDPKNTLLVATKGGVTQYGSNGSPSGNVGALEPRTLAFDRLGKLLTIHETGLRAEGKTPVPLVLPILQGKAHQLKPTDAVMTSIGEYLVADDEEKVIYRFSGDGKYIGEFAKADVRRLAIDDLDNVAALSPDTKAVTVFARDGKIAKQLAEKGTNYQFKNPSDVALDAFGHLYVMDRTGVFVFSADGSKLISNFTIAEKAPGAIGNAEALALDRSGRLYVFDSRTDSVKVYR
jgi:outer membrane protein assembly factor BamD (BamD/ComL family)